MMFAYSKNIQTHLVGIFDLFDQVAQTVRRADSKARVILCRCEAIDADLQLSLVQLCDH